MRFSVFFFNLLKINFEIGMRQLFKVGKRFHQRYINSTSPLLSKNYYNKEVPNLLVNF